MDEINSYDIEKIYSDMEKYLVANIKRNLTDDLNSFHKKEEKEYGFEWEAWQTAKLRDMQKFRKQNKDIINGRTKNIGKKIARVLSYEARQGKLNAFKGYKEALVHGYKSSVAVKDSFFKTNGRKVRNLIKSTTNDFKVANHATLRRSNDVYRQIIAEASMYNQTGVMTSKQAIKKAIQDFENRGINSIEYSNGAKHKISEYASMAIKTASTRSMLAGEGELRKKVGSSLILMSKHNTACKLCQPWENKVLIDDVYSGGSKEDGNYPLLSQAMKEGLYHPNCKHGHGTYFPELSKDINHEIIEKVEDETPTKQVPTNTYQSVHVTTSENAINIMNKGFLKSKMNKGIFMEGVYSSNNKDVIDYYKKSMDNSIGINLVYDTTDYVKLKLSGLQENEENLFNNLIKQLSLKIKQEYEALLSTRRKSPYKYRKTFIEILKKNGYKGLILKHDLSMIDDKFYKANKTRLDKINNTYIDPITGGSQIVGWDLNTIKIKRNSK